MKDFQTTMQEHLVAFKEVRQYLPPTNLRKPWEYVEITDNLYPPIRNGFLQYAYDTCLDFHDYARHVRSSQAFGFNLFYPLLRRHTTLPVFDRILGRRECRIESWRLEYQPDADHLGEWRGGQKPIDYVTSVDLHVQLRGPGGETLVLLCEVKFTEAKFSKCGGYTSPGNRDKSFCEAEFDAASVPGRCYLVAQKGRRYFQHSLAVYQSLSTGRCPFADNNQCQRNHALAKALIGAGKADEAYFGLVYHDANREILQEWDRYTALCKQEEQKRFLFTVPASELLACCEDETLRRYFADRYMVNLTTPESTVNPIETI